MNTNFSNSTWDTLKENISTYLVTTTIHGCRYLYEGRNWIEKLSWMLIIGLSFSCSIYTISHSITEANKEPILTTLHTTKIKEVPFPAVTIGGDANVNPWGFAEKLFNFLAFYYPKVYQILTFTIWVESVTGAEGSVCLSASFFCSKVNLSKHSFIDYPI